MFIFQQCSQSTSPIERRLRYQTKKLELLENYRDSLESRLSAIKASIQTINEQIERNKNHLNDETNN